MLPFARWLAVLSLTLTGAHVPSFSARMLDGGTVTNDALAGKVVVIDFFYLGCGPCIAELPELNRVVEEYPGKDVVFLAFARDPEAKVLPFVESHPFKFRVGADAESVARLFGVHGWPTHVVLDRNGVVMNHGFSDWRHVREELHDAIDGALASTPGTPAAIPSLTRDALTPEVQEALATLRQSGRPDLADELVTAIGKGLDDADRVRGARVAMGRVQLSRGDDPRDISFQSRIREGGWFVTTVARPEDPIVFAKDGYLPLSVTLPPGTSRIAWLGDLTLAPLPPDQAARFRGHLQTQGPALASVQLKELVAQPPCNSPGNGFEPRPHWPRWRTLRVGSDGSFEADGLPPTAIQLSVSCPGCVRVLKTISLSPGVNPEITLPVEAVRRLGIEYVAGGKLPLGGEVRKDALAGGDIFRAQGPGVPLHGYTFQIVQQDGGLFARMFFVPSQAYLLDQGLTLQDGIRDPFTHAIPLPNPFRLEPGRIYAIDSQHLGEKVVFQVTEP